MQPQGHLQLISNTVDYGMDAQAALDAPRWYWAQDRRVHVEPRVPPPSAARSPDAATRSRLTMRSISSAAGRRSGGWLTAAMSRAPKHAPTGARSVTDPRRSSGPRPPRGRGCSLRLLPLQLEHAGEQAVDERGRIVGGKLPGEQHGLADRDAIGYGVGVQQLEHADPQDVPVHGRHPVECPARRMAGQQRVDAAHGAPARHAPAARRTPAQAGSPAPSARRARRSPARPADRPRTAHRARACVPCFARTRADCHLSTTRPGPNGRAAGVMRARDTRRCACRP